MAKKTVNVRDQDTPTKVNARGQGLPTDPVYPLLLHKLNNG